MSAPRRFGRLLAAFALALSLGLAGAAYADHHEPAANPCNPCTAKNPCNPCDAKAENPCNPCTAKNPCNPCDAKAENPCSGK